MALFGLNAQEVANGYNAAAAQPYDAARDSPGGFFEGAGTALANVPESSAAGLALLGNTVGSKLFGETDDDKDTQADLVSIQKSLRPDPAVTGMLGELVHGVGKVLPQATLGTLAGGPVGAMALVGATQGNEETQRLESEGVDPSTARKAGVVEGIGQGLGVVAPAAFGTKILTKVATGSAINTVSGAVQRGVTGHILASNGYKDMADQYRVLDGMSLLTDSVLGAGFGALHGGGHEPLQSDLDTALAANSVRQAEIEAAPGIPTDIATRNAHMDSLNRATEQAGMGEPVNVSDTMTSANFLPKPIDSEHIANMADALHEAGFGDIVNANDKMRDYAARADDLTNDIRSIQGAIDQASTPEGKLSYLDPESADRVRLIDNELAQSGVTAQRRSALQQERDMVTSNENFPDAQTGMLDALTGKDEMAKRALEIKREKLQKRLQKATNELRRHVSNLPEDARARYSEVLGDDSAADSSAGAADSSASGDSLPEDAAGSSGSSTEKDAGLTPAVDNSALEARKDRASSAMLASDSGFQDSDLESHETARKPSEDFSTAKIAPETLTGGKANFGAMEPTEKGGKQAKVYHTSNSKATLLETAQRHVKPVGEWLKAHVSDIDGAKFLGSRVKKEAEVDNKIDLLGRRPDQVSDYLGARIEIDSIKAAREVEQRLRDDAHVLETDDFLENPRSGSGYRAIHMQLVAKDGFSYEVQIVPRELMQVYDQAREPYAKWKGYRGNIPEDKAAAYIAEIRKGDKVFNDAWQRFEERQSREKGEAETARQETEAKTPEVNAAEAVAAAKPDLQVPLEDGTMVSAQEALRQADVEIERTKEEGGVFQAAVNCFLRFGNA